MPDTAQVELNNSTNSSKLQFRYSDIKDVKEQIRLKNSENYQIIIDSREENRMFGEILSWILPLVFFIVIWILIMRRMGGGTWWRWTNIQYRKIKSKIN